MSARKDEATQRLLDEIAGGDGKTDAVDRLLQRFRSRLKKLIAVRLDMRLQARVDPSDVVQETLISVHKKLPQYLQQQPLPFYPWLRQIALERIIDHHRRHLHAQARSVKLEQHIESWLPDHSAQRLADCLIASGVQPESRLKHREVKAKIKAVLAKLPASYREVLVIKFLEEVPTREAAAILGITEGGVRSRQLRALQKFRELLADESEES